MLLLLWSSPIWKPVDEFPRRRNCITFMVGALTTKMVMSFNNIKNGVGPLWWGNNLRQGLDRCSQIKALSQPPFPTRPSPTCHATLKNIPPSSPPFRGSHGEKDNVYDQAPPLGSPGWLHRWETHHIWSQINEWLKARSERLTRLILANAGTKGPMPGCGRFGALNR